MRLPKPHPASLLPVLLAATVAALAPSAANAATTVTKSGGVITVTADETANVLRSDVYFDRFGIQEENGGIVTAGDGCTPAGPNAVECGIFTAGDRIVVNLGGGNDDYKYATIDPSQTVNGEGGNDTIETGNGNDVVNGGIGNDDLTGGRGDDTLDGGEGDDKVDGWDGSDSVTGGPGVDTLLGDGGTLYSGGNDKIFARDGAIDSVDCGGGADTAEVDGNDVVSACVTVNKPTTGIGGGGQSNPTPNPTNPTNPGAALTLTGKITKTQKLGALADGKKLTVTLTASSACSGVVRIVVAKAEAKKRKLASTELLIGTTKVTALSAGQNKLKVGIVVKTRKKLRSVRKLNATVAFACTSATNQAATGETKTTFKK